MTFAQRSFQIHAVAYMSVNLMLFIIWILSGGGHPWFVYPLLGWGVALGVHSTVAWTSGRSEDELEPPSRPALPG